jgi:hypothetical protein
LLVLRNGLSNCWLEVIQTEWFGEIGERTHLHEKSSKLLAVS